MGTRTLRANFGHGWLWGFDLEHDVRRAQSMHALQGLDLDKQVGVPDYWESPS